MKYVIPLHVCMENTALGGMSRGYYSMRQSQVLYLPRHPPTSAVFFVHTSIGSALSVILYFLVVWLRVIFYSTQTAAIFGDQDISKCLYNLLLFVE